MRRLGWFSLFFAAAAGLFVLFRCVLPFLVAGLVIALAAVALRLRKHGWTRLAVAALGLSVGLLWACGFDCWISAPIRALGGKTESFCAILRDDPQSTKYGASVFADAKIKGRSCRLLLYLRELPAARSGDRLELTALLATPEGENYDLYYRSNGVDLIAYAKPGAIAAPAEKFSLKTIPLLLRRALKDKINELYPADAAPFMQALLAGDRSGLTFAQTNALSVSGIAHTVAISGMHVAILLGFITLLCGNRRQLTALIGIPVVLCYTLMVGAMPSVTRACVMQIMFLLSPLLLKDADAFTSLGAAALVVLVPNPFAIANLSAQLSFGAMAGIALVSAPIASHISERPVCKRIRKRRFFYRPLRYFINTTASTFGACVLTVPLIAWQFGLVSLLSIVTNLLTLWAVTLVFQTGLTLCLLGFVWMWPAKLLAGLAAYLIGYILAVAAGITALPFAAVYTDSQYIIFWLFFVYLIVLCCLLPGGKRLILPGTCIGALGLCLCLWLGYLDAGRMETTLLDVGQGQCLILQDTGATIIYDCGGSRAEEAGENAARLLLSRGAGAVDLLIVSHYDADHAGGVCQLLERVPVMLLYLPELPCDTALREDIERCARKTGTELRYVTEDISFRFASSTLHIFAPVMTNSDNDASLGLLYSKGSYDILATGDMAEQAELLLLSRHDIPDIEVLVAGHHGAATSVCDTLLARTQPETVLISVGEDNAYHHPSPSTLTRIEAHNASIYRTDQCGTITIG